MKRAVILDPASFMAKMGLAMAHFTARRYGVAATQMGEALELDPERKSAHGMMAVAYVACEDDCLPIGRGRKDAQARNGEGDPFGQEELPTSPSSFGVGRIVYTSRPSPPFRASGAGVAFRLHGSGALILPVQKRGKSMKRNIARTIAVATLVLGAAVMASAQEHACSNPGLAGAWGYTETGTVVVPSPTGTIQVPAAAVGRYDFDSAGSFSGTQNSSAGGAVSEDLKLGTYTLNPDCTGTLSLQVYDPSGTTLRRTSVWAIVLVDKAREFRGIMISTLLPNGVSLAPIMTMTGKRLFRDRSVEP
ncbi:MAG TPA: hypothetical protein VK886_14205 [Vicinamibacterales bacterium]|nr:hypothetical protein [Vicinamibacterales bacterium]